MATRARWRKANEGLSKDYFGVKCKYQGSYAVSLASGSGSSKRVCTAARSLLITENVTL